MRHFWWLLAAACAALTVPAQARPRDDALSGAFRCAAIGDSRQWLDCYYGAAQPVRAALGLAPALAAQLKLAAAPPGGQPRDEAVRDEVMAGAAACNRVAGDRPWLDCYYASAASMRSTLGLSGAPAPRPQTAHVPPPAPRPVAAPSGPPPMPRSTGLLNGLFNQINPIVRDMPMKSFTLDRHGAFTVTLADGQVWVQAAEDQVYHPAHWRDAGPNTLVTIEPDAMHTFTMSVAGDSRIYKVKRLR